MPYEQFVSWSITKGYTYSPDEWLSEKDVQEQLKKLKKIGQAYARSPEERDNYDLDSPLMEGINSAFTGEQSSNLENARNTIINSNNPDELRADYGRVKELNDLIDSRIDELKPAREVLTPQAQYYERQYETRRADTLSLTGEDLARADIRSPNTLLKSPWNLKTLEEAQAVFEKRQEYLNLSG